VKAALVAAAMLAIAAVHAAEYPAPSEADFRVHDFEFASGEHLAELRIHYRTLGQPTRDAAGVVRNAVLILHGTTGNGSNFIRPEFAGELFGPGAPLDVQKYFVIIPDGIGHGGSSKPSDGLRAHFPHYGYRDMVEAQWRLVHDGLAVNHLRLIMGTSMGGMHTWLWGELHPTDMDALMPLASLPTQVSGRNRVWRRLIIDAIRNDPGWQGGDYQRQPAALATAEEMLWLMGSNPPLRQQEAPTRERADAVIDAYVAAHVATDDANDILYALAASSDYDPEPHLASIRARLIAVNSADDLINPPELGILQRDIRQVPHGKCVLIPYSEQTRGHGSHTIAVLWKQYLQALLKP
jgi:homoserine O-acetyltransferase